jgi:molybdenum cofactor cytidylyltransferase
MMSGQQFFAVLPAAGHSRRMGRPKLLLPWAGRPLVAQLLAAWRNADVPCVAVVRRDDRQLAEVCRAAGAEVVTPDRDPPDMRASVEEALQWLDEHRRPQPQDYWLLAPADMPQLTGDLIRQVLAACQPPGPIVTPVFSGRRGHPTAFPWTMAAAARRLPDGQGLNQLLLQHPVRECPLASRAILEDIDTPEAYQRLNRGHDKP